MILGFQPPDLWEINFCCLSILLGQPQLYKTKAVIGMFFNLLDYFLYKLLGVQLICVLMFLGLLDKVNCQLSFQIVPIYTPTRNICLQASTTDLNLSFCLDLRGSWWVKCLILAFSWVIINSLSTINITPKTCLLNHRQTMPGKSEQMRKTPHHKLIQKPY